MKKAISILLVLCVVCASLVFASVTANAGSVIENAIAWAVNIANDDSHGYSQTSRYGPDYDCSSLVITAFNNAGVSTGSATYTGNMISNFEANGFTWIPWSTIGSSSNLQRGDILLNIQYHTAIYMGNNQVVEAHARSAADKAYDNRDVRYANTLQGDQDGQEIRVTNYYWYSSGGWDGVLRLNETPDNEGPAFDDFHVGELQSGQFTILAHVTDSSGISSVRYAVWTENNGQDDIKWYDGHCTDGNDYYWSRIQFSNHNNEKGKYIIHMYAYDNAGNLTNPGISYNFDSNGPSYSDFRVGEFRTGAFTILAKVTDINGVSSVRYAVWTENNGQDDIKWYDGKCTDNNDYYWAHVNFSEHNNEKGKYTIHMYAYDTAGKLMIAGINYDFPETGPIITNVDVSNISCTGYTITCNVSADIGVSRVQFPTWTEKDDQDDLAPEWWTNTSVRGTINGDTVTFRVKNTDHNCEIGTYVTHIYAYDTLGTATTVHVSKVELPSPLSNVEVKDVNETGYTVTCDVDTSWSSIDRIEFPTWTITNDQDDLIWHKGTVSNGKGYCRISTSDHGNDITDIYKTHIYLWDKNGNKSSVGQLEFPNLMFDYGKALAPTFLGDADGNGDIEIFDATLIQRYVSNMTVPYPDETLMNADVDGDDELTILDATFIQRHIARITTPYPIGEVIS